MQALSPLSESLVSRLSYMFLSTTHWLLLTAPDAERLSLPNTTSPIYNFSLYLNESLAQEDKALIEASAYWGYPSDAFAAMYVRDHPWFVVFLQTIVLLLGICFAVMAGVVFYYTFLADADAERKQRELDRLMAEIGTRQGTRGH